MVSYDVKITDRSRQFCQDMEQTLRVFRDAVRYLTDITLLHFEEMKQAKVKYNFIEKLVHLISLVTAAAAHEPGTGNGAGCAV